MSEHDDTTPRATVDHGAASRLFPIEDLDTTVYQYRDAELALAGAEPAHIVVTPTGFASALFLARHTLTAVPIVDLSLVIQSDLDAALADPVETFELVQIGDRPSDSPNHSLTEFTDS